MTSDHVSQISESPHVNPIILQLLPSLRPFRLVILATFSTEYGRHFLHCRHVILETKTEESTLLERRLDKRLSRLGQTNLEHMPNASDPSQGFNTTVSIPSPTEL